MKSPIVTPNFRGARVLITGGLGFIGSNLAIRLVEAGARVVLVDAMIPEYGGNLFNIEPIRDKVTVNFGDICDRHAMDWLVRAQDYVFHLAGQVSHIKSMIDPFPDVEYNIKGTVVLMEALRRHNPTARVVFTGTRGQYGVVARLPVDETAHTNPKGLYEISNLTAEKIIHVYHLVHGIPAVLLRLTNVYGPRAQMKHSQYGVANWFIRMALDGVPIKVFGDGSFMRDFLFVDDCVDALLLCAHCEKAYGEIFNIGVDKPTTFRELAEMLTRVCEGASWEFAPFSAERKAQEPGDYYSDITKIRTVVGWEPVTSLEDGMRRTLNYYRLNCDHYWTNEKSHAISTTKVLHSTKQEEATEQQRSVEVTNKPNFSSQFSGPGKRDEQSLTKVRTDAIALDADFQRFKDLSFEGFRVLAKDQELSCYQKIGFPDAYRRGYETAIFRDIRTKLPRLDANQQVVLDIGTGCSELPRMLIDHCRQHEHRLILCDSAEMLSLLPSSPEILKIAGRYPQEAKALFADYTGSVDLVICYSVLHYVFPEQPLFDFLDRTLSLLSQGGACLLGDIPNISKRKRFFNSDSGVRCHQDFIGKRELPEVRFNCPEPGKLDDAVVLAILARCRAAGFDAYVLPQLPEFPMSSRREDILICRP